MDWDKVEWSKFSPEEAHRLRHRMIEEKHRNHDMMHAEMILILFGSIMVAQVLLYVWRQRNPRSYTAVTLLGLWVIPIAFSFKMFFWKMIIVWTLFSIVTAFVMFKATRKKISVNTPRYEHFFACVTAFCVQLLHTHSFNFSLPPTFLPSLPPSLSLSIPFRLVYRWFLFIYQATYVAGIIGYVILLLIFTGIGLLLPLHPDTIIELGVTLIFYGVYFGVMGRDCAEMCVDYMAAGMTVSKLPGISETGGRFLTRNYTSLKREAYISA